MLDRPTIETMLQQIQAGELSLEQATQRLLADQVSCETQLPETQLPETQRLETLASLLGRLGHPPWDVAEIWCDQFRNLISELPSLPDEVSLDDFEITNQGTLAWCGDADSLSVASSEAAVDQAVLSFRNYFLDEPASPVAQREVQEQVQEQASERPEKKQPSRIPNFAIAGGLVICAVALFWLLRGTPVSEVASTETLSTEARGTQSANTNIFDPSPVSQSPSPADRRGFASELELPIETFDTGELETLESLSDAEFESLEAAVEEQPSFSLDRFMPSMPSSPALPSTEPPVAEADEPEADTPDANESASDGPAAEVSLSLGDASLDLSASESDPTSEPEELQQATQTEQRQTASVQYATLPDPKDDDLAYESALISETQSPVGSIVFPNDSTIELTSAGDQTWSISDTKKSLKLAELKTTEEGLSFRWDEQGSKSPLAGSLRFARIETKAGEKIYLRPLVQADPWAITVDKVDVRPTWDLRSPVPPRVSRLAVEIDLPDGVEESWVEVIEPDKVRRGRGAVMLVPTDGESVALAMRLDIKTGRKVSCRIRFAARLDSSQPWQPVSRPLLNQFADQVAYQLGLISREAQRLSGVHDIAGPRGKRIIRLKQTRNDGLADQVREIADRVAQLQALIADVESGARLRAKVWAEWPDGEQTILMCGEE